MSLVRNDGVPSGRQFGILLQRIEQRREGLDGHNDDTGLLGQSFSQLLRFTLVAQITIDGSNHALSVLKLVDGVLKLAIQHRSVGHDDDRAEQLIALVIVELRQLMGRPGNGVGFAGARTVLDEVALAGTFFAGRLNQMVDHVPLVVPGENQGFLGLPVAMEIFFGFLFQVQKTAKDLKPGVFLEQLLP